MTARWSLMLATIAQFAIPASHADEFRVETDVYVGEAPQPVAETLTLFKNGVIYDFLMTEPREATVFDVSRGRIVLLASQSRTKAEITTEELVQFTAAIRRRASGQQQQPLFGTEFAGEFDEESLEVLLQGQNLVYRAKGVLPKTKVAVQQYREFADWYARLNSARPGNPPPFARLELNRQLAENGLVPDEIHRSLNLPGRLRGLGFRV